MRRTLSRPIARRAARLLAGIATAGLLLVGCNREPKEAPPAPPLEPSAGTPAPNEEPKQVQTVPVLLTDESIQVAGSVTPGVTVLQIHNGGKERHSLMVDGPPGQMRVDGVVAPGADTRLAVTLVPGVYTLRCPIDGHNGLPQQMMVTEPSRGF